ncbi:hypothetical protein AB0O57_29185 [Streptomyces sp. NPDC091201]|uniref:hypothetical protein n=1 Tax=Streptomyces sp. NPDC091201 TaxID=3155190 RepID=UPI00343A82A4
MSVLAVDAPTRGPWDGRLVVRTAGGRLLHIGAEGAVSPGGAVFTVALECCRDQSQAPGVRPWAGPVDEARVCPACLRSLRGEPEPVLPLVEAGAPVRPAEAAPGRRLWAVPSPAAWAAAALPAEHRGRPITWSSWTPAPVITHYSSACSWCGDAGPCEMAGGRQGSPQSVTDPLRRYVAYRCSYCQEMTAYEHVGTDLEQIAHYKSRAPKGSRR